MNTKTILSALAKPISIWLHNIKSIANSQFTRLPRPKGPAMTNPWTYSNITQIIELFTTIFIKNLANPTKKWR